MIYSFSRYKINNKVEGLSDKTRTKLGEFQRDIFWLSVNCFFPRVDLLRCETWRMENIALPEEGWVLKRKQMNHHKACATTPVTQAGLAEALSGPMGPDRSKR